MSKIKNQTTCPWILILPVLVVWLTAAGFFIFHGVPLQDEKLFHYPTALLFHENPVLTAINSPEYGPANTPLPYIITKLLTPGFVPGIHFCRFLSFLFSLFSLFFLFKTLKLLNKNGCLYDCLALIVFFPYFFRSSFTFYMASFGLFFGILSLFLYLSVSNTISRYFFSGLAASLAILCQQFYLAVSLAIITHAVSITIEKKDFKPFLFSLISFIPLILPLLVFISWLGLTHPKYQHDSLAFTLNPQFLKQFPITNISAILTITGFYFLPVSIFKIREIHLKWLIPILILSIILGIFNVPEFSSHQGFNKITGLVHRLIQAESNFLPYAAYPDRIFLIFSGLICLFTVFNIKKDKNSDFLKWLLLFFILCFFTDSLLSERHLLALMILLFIFQSYFKLNNKIYTGWIIVMGMISIVYSVQWFFVAGI